MSDFVVAKRYAKALYDSAQAAGDAERVNEELQATAEVYEREQDFRAVMSHPAIATEAKLAFLKDVFGEGLSELMYSTLQLLVERGRFSVLPSLQQAYANIADERAGRAKARVYSAQGLTDTDREAISAQFSKLTGKQISVENIIDPSLIGGIRVRIGDRLYEGSVAGKLEQLRNQLKDNA